MNMNWQQEVTPPFYAVAGSLDEGTDLLYLDVVSHLPSDFSGDSFICKGYTALDIDGTTSILHRDQILGIITKETFTLAAELYWPRLMVFMQMQFGNPKWFFHPVQDRGPEVYFIGYDPSRPGTRSPYYMENPSAMEFVPL